MEVVVDSNVLVAFFLKEEVNRGKAKEFYRLVIRQEIKPIISALVLPEVCGAIKRRSTTDAAEEVFKKLSSLIDSNFFEVAELSQKRMHHSAQTAINFGIRGADAIHVALSQEFGIPLFTFDEEINKKVKGVTLFKL